MGVLAADAAVAAADAIGYPVAVKAQAPELVHKVAAGAVRLGCRDAGTVRAAIETMAAHLAATPPELTLHGWLVSEMVPAGPELIVGVDNRSGLGPMVVSGLGGLVVEALASTVMWPSPFGPATAGRLLERARIAGVVRAACGDAAVAQRALEGLAVVWRRSPSSAPPQLVGSSSSRNEPVPRR